MKENIEKPLCGCAETLIHGVRIIPPLWHSCEYIRLRNERLGDVCREADRIVERMSDENEDQRRVKLSYRASIISHRMDVIGREIIHRMEQKQ